MLKHLDKIRALLSKSEKKALLILSILLFIGMFLEVLGLGILLPLITLILDPDKLNSIFDQSGFISINRLEYDEKVLLSLLSIIIVYIIKAFFQILITHRQNFIIERLGADLGSRLYQKYLYQDYLQHINGNLSDLIKNTQIEINNFILFCRAMLMLFVEITLIISILFTIVYIEPIGAILVGIFFGILSFFYFQVTKRRIKNWGNERQVFDKNISKIVLESLSGVKEIKISMKESYFKNLHLENINGRVKVSSNHQTFTQLPRIYLELITVFGLIIFIQIMFFKGDDSTKIITTLGIFIAATFRMIPSINRMLSSLQNLKYYSSSVEIIFNEFKDYFKTKYDNKDLISVPFSKNIKIENLTFSYKKDIILDDINLNIQKGDVIGIIGSSGSGKSTFIDLINGLLKPSMGKILVDGIDINKKKNDWKKNIGYVGQDIFLIDDTIKKNIAFGIQESEIDIQMLNEAILASKLKTFIDTLEYGLNTKVGDRGIQLSGGQKQRIAIARALYCNPSFLIFDEATASLDEETERDIMKSIYDLKGDKTIIMIAHRLKTLKNCDTIFEIKQGILSPINKELFINNIS